MMTSFWIWNTVFGFRMSCEAPALERHPTSRSRATEPRLPHTAPVGVTDERTGVTAKLGQWGAPKGAVPSDE